MAAGLLVFLNRLNYMFDSVLGKRSADGIFNNSGINRKIVNAAVFLVLCFKNIKTKGVCSKVNDSDSHKIASGKAFI
jgi:hypothetical protein